MIHSSSPADFIFKNEKEFKNLIKFQCECLHYTGDQQDLLQDLYLKILTTPIVQNFKEDRFVIPYRININKHKCVGCGSCAKMCPDLFKLVDNISMSKMKRLPFKHRKKFAVLQKICNAQALSIEAEEGFSTKIKISTYVCHIIKNHIRQIQISNEYRLLEQSYKECDLIDTMHSNHFIDLSLQLYPMDLSRQNLILNNGSVLQRDLGLELKAFKRINKTNKKLNKPKKAPNKSLEYTLMDIFKYLYQGYTNKDIAEMYGISNMYVTYMKQELKKELIRQGFNNASTPVKQPECCIA